MYYEPAPRLVITAEEAGTIALTGVIDTVLPTAVVALGVLVHGHGRLPG